MSARLKTQSSFSRAIAKWAGLWKTPRLPQLVTISYSSRLRRSLGRTRPVSATVTLNSQLAAAPRAVVLEVLCHELAHIAAHQLYGCGISPHGPEWRTLVQSAGYTPSVALTCSWVTPSPRNAPSTTSRERYQCPVCRTEYFSKRRGSRLVCTLCLGAGRTTPITLVPQGLSSR